MRVVLTVLETSKCSRRRVVFKMCLSLQKVGTMAWTESIAGGSHPTSGNLHRAWASYGPRAPSLLPSQPCHHSASLSHYTATATPVHHTEPGV